MAQSIQRSGRGRTAEGKPNPIDLHVGRRIRERRTAMGISQDALAKIVGVTYQQTHKYETGHNRISASRLVSFAAALRVPVAFFFEDMDATSKTAGIALLRGQLASTDVTLPPAPCRADLEVWEAWSRLPESARDPLRRAIKATAAATMAPAVRAAE